MICRVSSASGIQSVFEAVTEVIVPVVDGSVGIRPGHEKYLSALGTGTLIIRKADEMEQEFEVDSGVVIVEDDVVSVALG